jgi:hypothetical protein
MDHGEDRIQHHPTRVLLRPPAPAGSVPRRREPRCQHRPLRIIDVQDTGKGVRLRLGPAPLQLPEPVDGLARTVTANRKGHATIGTLTPSPGCSPANSPTDQSAPHS